MASIKEEEYVKIPLRNQAHDIIAHALVDKKNEVKINSYSWWLSDGYALAYMVIDGKKRVIRMHRFIMNANKGDPLIDHKNGEKIDNREDNLRFSNPSENSHNHEKKIKHNK